MRQLFEYVARGDFNNANALIESGSVDPCAKRLDGSTALHKAAWNGHLRLVRLLVLHQCDITALLTLKMDNGANINVQDRRGYCPLYLAVVRKHNAVVEYLANEGMLVMVCCS